MLDVTHILKDAYLVAASDPGLIDDNDAIINLGEGLVEGHLVVDVSAIEIDSNDELYRIALEGSSSQSFLSGTVDLAILELGASEVLGGDGGTHPDSSIGRYIIPFRTERNGVIYPYVRLYITVSGTVATGINFTAYLAK